MILCYPSFYNFKNSFIYFSLIITTEIFFLNTEINDHYTAKAEGAFEIKLVFALEIKSTFDLSVYTFYFFKTTSIFYN